MIPGWPTLAHKLAQAGSTASAALAQLPGWNRSAAELRRLPVPLDATLDQFEARLQEIRLKRESITSKASDEDVKARELGAMLQSLELQQDVPTEDMLLAARQRRDKGWRLVKSAWLNNAALGDDAAEFVAEHGPDDHLAAAYEQSVRRGDDLADRLRREADRVARKAEGLARLAQHQASRATLEEEARFLDECRALIDREWAELVEPLGLGVPW